MGSIAEIWPRGQICERASAVMPMFVPRSKISEILLTQKRKHGDGIAFEFFPHVSEVIVIPIY
jgi:hypothetical protein